MNRSIQHDAAPTSLPIRAAALLAMIFGLIVIRMLPLYAQSNDAPDFSKVVIHRLPSPVNTRSLDYAPAVTPDGLTLYFISDRPGGIGGHDFWVTTKTNRLDTIFTPPRNLGSPINTPLNEGLGSVSADGRTLYFTGCNRNDGRGDCDIYEAHREGDEWKDIRDIQEINSSEWDSQPSISVDGSTLYFVSNRPGATGGFGDADIYVSFKTANGIWSKPMNLGAPINTAQREDSPFILPGGRALYFASQGHRSLGGLDLFVSRLQPSGRWGEPVNLGAPINTKRDERFISLPATEDVIYFSSERDNTPPGGELDLYMGVLSSQPKPPGSADSTRREPDSGMLSRLPAITLLVRGRVYDRSTGHRIQAYLKFVDSATGEMVYQAATNPMTGTYAIPVDASKGRMFTVSILAPGYDLVDATIDLPQLKEYAELRADFPLHAPTTADSARSQTDETEEEGKMFLAYPDPVSDTLTVDCTAAYKLTGTKHLVISDEYDNVLTETTFTADICSVVVSALTDGVYTVRIEDIATIFVVKR